MSRSVGAGGTRHVLAASLRAAVPVMLGYVVIGLPCGLMEDSIGFSPLQCFLLSSTFYSGAGQFMIPNMWLAGAPLYSIIASVSFVNTRQVLYSAAFSPFFSGMDRFQTDGGWTALHGLFVNLFCMFTWASANAVGCALGAVLDLPLAITSFAMTAIFICLLAGQKMTRQTAVVMAVSAAGVAFCKLVGLGGPAILLGAVAGVIAGMFVKPGGGESA